MSPVTTPTESRREARLSRHRRATGRRLAVVLAILVGGGLGILGAMPASAYWQSAGSGTATVSTGTLAAPTKVSAAASGTSVVVGWTASVGSLTPSGYFVTRTSSGGTVAACASSATSLVTGTSCTDAAVPVGTYTYAVTAVYRSWTAVSAPSGSVTVAPAASNLTFTTSPTTTVAGAAFSVAVALQTATGVAVATANVPVALALGANPGGSTLAGTKTATTDATGVATFTGLALNKVGAGYTLAATSTGLVSATSPVIAVTAGAATTFAFTTAPVAGVASATANLGPITVQLRDAFGNSAVAPAGLTLTLGSSSTGAVRFSPTASGTGAPVSIAAGAGSTSFFYGDTKAGTPLLSVSTAGLTGSTQTATLAAGAVARLAFSSASLTAGVATATANLGPLTVQLQDAFGNPAISSNAVDVALTSNSSKAATFALTSGGPAVTKLSVPATVSTATFYYGDTGAGSPTITATAAGLVTATQVQTIVAGAPMLWFVQQPITTVIGGKISPAVTVKIADAFQNPIATTASVSIAIFDRPNANGELVGTVSVTPTNGLFTFADLVIRTKGSNGNQATGTGYTLQVSSPGLTPVTSSAFDITK